MKKVIVFDLDDTLAITKSPIEDRMSMLLSQLLNSFDVCIISGGRPTNRRSCAASSTPFNAYMWHEVLSL
jgi:phosphomannomutase